MRTLSDFAGDGGKKPGVPTPTTPTVNAATSEQVHTLLHAAVCMCNLLKDDVEEVDRNARDSACATFINITNRLDAIVSDEKRWAVDQYDKVVESVGAMYRQQTEYMAKATKLAEKDLKRLAGLEAPHNQRNVSFFALSNGEFMACDGDPASPSSIKATGVSPQEAAEAFDEIWLGKVPYQPFATNPPKGKQASQ